jgi:two-component system repressor protein LuxO
VRQLQNVVRNAVVLHDADRVAADMLPPALLRPPPPRTETAAASAPGHGLTPAVMPLEQAVPPPGTRPDSTPPMAVPIPAAMPLQGAPPASPSFPLAVAPAPATAAPATPLATPLVAPVVWGPRAAAPEPPPPIEPLAVMEKRLILAALAEMGQDVVRAAALLEINPSTIYRKLAAWKEPRRR